MNERSEGRLGARFDEALAFAMELHRTQLRKGSDVPYVGHLLGVSSIVIDAGGTEDEAIAALLHDGPEDQGGRSTLAAIRGRFGDEVANMVEHLSDTFDTPKPPWRARKEAYINDLRACQDASVYLISAADKVHNLRSMRDDYREVGEALWSRFSAPLGRVDVLWYHDALLAAYDAGPPDPRRSRVVHSMRETIAEIRALEERMQLSG
jgi:(p)ppGpp synthase/HD superfamily hydrolase